MKKNKQTGLVRNKTQTKPVLNLNNKLKETEKKSLEYKINLTGLEIESRKIEYGYFNEYR